MFGGGSGGVGVNWMTGGWPMRPWRNVGGTRSRRCGRFSHTI